MRLWSKQRPSLCCRITFPGQKLGAKSPPIQCSATMTLLFDLSATTTLRAQMNHCQAFDSTRTTLAQPYILVVTLVADSVFSTIHFEESQLPAIIILKQPLAHIKQSTSRLSLEVSAVLVNSTLATTSLVNCRHLVLGTVFLVFFSLHGPSYQHLLPTLCTLSGRGGQWRSFLFHFFSLFSAAFSEGDTDNGLPFLRSLMYPPSPLKHL